MVQELTLRPEPMEYLVGEMVMAEVITVGTQAGQVPVLIPIIMILHGITDISGVMFTVIL